MAAADDGFTERVGAAWEEQGVATTLQDDIAERLDDMKRATVVSLAAFQAGINMQQSLDPAGVRALGDALLARVLRVSQPLIRGRTIHVLKTKTLRGHMHAAHLTGKRPAD